MINIPPINTITLCTLNSPRIMPLISILTNGSVNYLNIITALILNAVYFLIGIALFYYSFSQARKKGSLINVGE